MPALKAHGRHRTPRKKRGTQALFRVAGWVVDSGIMASNVTTLKCALSAELVGRGASENERDALQGADL